MIDPGSTGTYIVDHISSFLSLKTGKEYKLDVQFLSLSRSLSVSATSFDIAPYADNDNKFHVQHAFSNPNVNLPPADTTELNDICQNFPQLRHIKFPDINPPRHRLCPLHPFVRVDSRSSQLSFRYSNRIRLENCRRVPSLLPKEIYRHEAPAFLCFP